MGGWAFVFALAAIGCGRINFDPSGADGTVDARIDMPPPGFGLAATSCTPVAATGPVVHVATTGNDNSGNGSAGAPWRTIQRTYDRVAPGTTIVVAAGVYNESLDLQRTVSPQRITIEAETPYTVEITQPSLPLSCNGCSGLALDGLYVHNTGGGLPVLHINSGDDVVVRNCIVENRSSSSAGLRASGSPRNIAIVRNFLIDGAPPLHLANTGNVTVEDNIIEHTPAANDGQLLWLEEPEIGGGTFRRNIIAGFRGCAACSTVELRLDSGSVFESNLFVSGPSPSNGVFKLEGSKNTTLTFNTIVGDFPGTAYALTASNYNATRVDNLQITNSIFSDPTGTMGDFSDGDATDVIAATLLRNLYWDDVATVTSDVADAIKPANDPLPVPGNPNLPQTAFIPVTWNPASSRFTDTSTTICDVFRSMAMQYGAIPVTSSAFGVASGIDRPPDLLGYARTTSSVGALEPP